MLLTTKTSEKDLLAALKKGAAVPDYNVLQLSYALGRAHPWSHFRESPAALLRKIKKADEEREEAGRLARGEI